MEGVPTICNRIAIIVELLPLVIKAPFDIVE